MKVNVIDAQGLKNAYANVKTGGAVLYVDETYNSPKDEDVDQTFYTLCGVLLKKDILNGMRKNLDDLVPTGWWHTTDALNENRHDEVVALLKMCYEFDDIYVFAHKTPLLKGERLEEARSECWQKLLVYVAEHYPELGLVIFESRGRASLDRADFSFVNKLRNEKKFPRATRIVSASPAVEHLLWIPDLMAMAHRRKLTHSGKDETGNYFDRYVQKNAIII